MADDSLSVGWKVAGAPSGDIPSDLARLIGLYPTLDAKVRYECLDLALRGLAKLR